MKKKILTALLLLLMCALSMFYFTACGKENIKQEHVHVFNMRVAANDFLYKEATCTEKAMYYYSCKCGAIGQQTFEYGGYAAHSYVCKNATRNYLCSEATCTEKATYYYSCKCGAIGQQTFE